MCFQTNRTQLLPSCASLYGRVANIETSTLEGGSATGSERDVCRQGGRCSAQCNRSVAQICPRRQPEVRARSGGADNATRSRAELAVMKQKQIQGRAGLYECYPCLLRPTPTHQLSAINDFRWVSTPTSHVAIVVAAHVCVQNRLPSLFQSPFPSTPFCGRPHPLGTKRVVRPRKGLTIVQSFCSATIRRPMASADNIERVCFVRLAAASAMESKADSALQNLGRRAGCRAHQ